MYFNFVHSLGFFFSEINEDINYPMYLVSAVFFAFYCSIPYLLSGFVGSVIQQLLVLNEQSVQDRRFTDESEALSKMTSLVFLMYCLQSGLIFKPVIYLFSYDINDIVDPIYFLFSYITSSMMSLFIVSSKYIVVIIFLIIACSYIDLFFKKAALSNIISSSIKALVIIIVINLWLIDDQYYIYTEMMKVFNYE